MYKELTFSQVSALVPSKFIFHALFQVLLNNLEVSGIHGCKHWFLVLEVVLRIFLVTLKMFWNVRESTDILLNPRIFFAYLFPNFITFLNYFFLCFFCW